MNRFTIPAALLALVCLWSPSLSQAQSAQAGDAFSWMPMFSFMGQTAQTPQTMPGTPMGQAAQGGQSFEDMLAAMQRLGMGMASGPGLGAQAQQAASMPMMRGGMGRFGQ